MIEHNFQTLAKYNQWMNDKLYACASKLSQDELTKDRGAFFGSIAGTLNHITVADILWLKRIAKHPAQFATLDNIRALTTPSSLHGMLFNDFDSLYKLRVAMDTDLIAFVAELDSELLASVLEYQDIAGNTHSNTLNSILLHVFNHQTHHRGQATTLFSQCGIDIGVTDLMQMLRIH